METFCQDLSPGPLLCPELWMWPSAWTMAGWGDGSASGRWLMQWAPEAASNGGCAAALGELLCLCCTYAVLVSWSPPPGWDGIKRCIVLPSPPPHTQCSDCVA